MYHQAALPAVSGKVYGGICPAEAFMDTAHRLKNTILFQPICNAPTVISRVRTDFNDNTQLSAFTSPASPIVRPECANAGNLGHNSYSTSNITLFYHNVGGMNTSVAEYKLAISDECYDLYAFTESWLCENTVNNQLFSESYSVYRQDRSPLNSCKTRGGGVLLAVRASYKSRLLTPPNCSSVEHLWVALTIDQHTTLYLCVTYIPPDRVSDGPLIEKHLESLNWVVSQLKARDSIVVLGDFNMSGITWQQNSFGSLFPNISRSTIDQISRNLLDGYCTAGLVQKCGVLNENNRLLDLCFVSKDISNEITVIQAPSPLVKSSNHHPPLHVIFNKVPEYSFIEANQNTCYAFKKANFEGMIDFLSNVDWDTVLDNCDTNLAGSTMSIILLYAIDQYVPIKTQHKPYKPAWSNSELRCLRSAKRAALRRFNKYRTDSSRLSYVQTNKNYKRLNYRLFNAYQRKMQSRLKSDPKSFWYFVNSQRKENGLPSSMTNGISEADTSIDIAEMFRTQFSSVFTDELLDVASLTAATRDVPYHANTSLQFAVTPDMVLLASKDLKCSTGCGPDNIPSLVLKRCMQVLAMPLAKIFTLSLSTGVFPDCWKESYVFPVFKKGCKRTVSNYRGIAALSATSKLFELIILSRLVHSYSHHISQNQHGFMPQRSTTTNLACFVSFVTQEIEKGNQVDAIYTDLSAAFDKVNHQIAVAKFEKLGMDNNSLT